MPVTRSMSSLFVSALTFASTWPWHRNRTAPDRGVHLGDAGQLTVGAAHRHRTAVDDARRGAVVGMDQHVGRIAEEVELGIEPPHLSARCQHERRRLTQLDELFDEQPRC